MGVRILSNDETSAGNHVSQAALYCSTSDWAFGPVFYGDREHDATERAEAFCRWLGMRDPRRLTEHELLIAYNAWRVQEAAQWAAEDGGMDDPLDAPSRQ